MKYLVFGLLIIYACLTRFSNSEFWPITISKTWLELSHFENSMLQKPLLTLILSFFHLFSLDDVTHLIIVKFLFAILNLLGLIAYIKFLLEVTNNNSKNWNTISLFAVLMMLLSPTYFHYFSSIRSDQLAFSLFAFFLLLCERKKIIWSFVTLLLIPLMGIKEIMFLIPGLVYFAFTFKHRFNKKTLFYFYYAGFAILIWAIALNIPLFYYLSESLSNNPFHFRFQDLNLKMEAPLLLASFMSWFYILIKKIKNLYKTLALSVYFTLVLLLFPEPYFFFIASLVPIIYLVLFSVLLQIPLSSKVKLALLLPQIVFIIAMNQFYQISYIQSVLPQYKYIKLAAKIVKENNLTYLDGMGLLPQQKFHPCFVSPNDPQANFGCINLIKFNKPEVIILTNRLHWLGDEYFKNIQTDYELILPNLWIHKNSLNEKIRSQTNLDAEVGVPMLLFFN